MIWARIKALYNPIIQLLMSGGSTQTMVLVGDDSATCPLQSSGPDDRQEQGQQVRLVAPPSADKQSQAGAARLSMIEQQSLCGVW